MPADQSPTAAEPVEAAPGSIAPLACSAVLTHHWLVRVRGGEKVLQALCELLPDAPIYTLIHDPAGMRGSPHTPGSVLDSRRVFTSLLQRIPGATRHYPKLLPLMPLAARRMKLPPADLVVCSDAALAKTMTPDPRSRVVCYCHSPMRYAFDPQISQEYRRTLPWGIRPFWDIATAHVRAADRRAAQRVDRFVANSRHVAARIRRCYGRDAVVVHPPVDLPQAPAVGPREDFYLCVGYHVAYKRLDLAVAACRRLNRRLVVIGDGPDVRRMEAQRHVDPHGLRHVELLGWQGPTVIQEHYRRAAGLLFPGEEDFGIVPVEAMAHGCPVIAYGVGGATESVVDGRTGVLFPQSTVDSLIAAVRRAESIQFDAVTMHRFMQRFGRERFLREMRAVLVGTLGSA